jgi:hypothetical protein
MAKATKPKAKKPKYTDKAESERFIETARKLGIEETGETFERAFEKIVPPRQIASPKRALSSKPKRQADS